MTPNRTRRRVLARTATTIAGLATVGASASADAPDRPVDKPAVEISSSGQGWSVNATARTVDRSGAAGTTIEDLRADIRTNFGLEYLRTVWWDGTAALDVREDTKQGTTRQYLNEQRAHNSEYFPLPTGNVYTSRNVLACEDKPAILIENSATNLVNGDYTAYTLFAPENGDDYRPYGWTTTRGDYDAIVFSNGVQYVVVGQRETWRRAFDGQRIGSPDDKTAREDIYSEQDGWIDTNTSNTGRIDAGIGLHLGNREGFGCCGWGDTEWLTAVGFGETRDAALDHMTEALENGYREEEAKTG